MSLQNLPQQISDYVKQNPSLLSKIAATVVVIFILWLVRLIIIRIINRNLTNTRQKYKWRKNFSYLTGFLGLLVFGFIWFQGLGGVGTFLGLLSAGLAIALRDPVTDFVGWMFISLNSPFDTGDRIEIGQIKGDIIDIRIFQFTVLEIGNWVRADQSTGRVIHVPNHKIFTESLANYTSDFKFIWNELEVLVTFESDWKKAKKVLQNIADKHLADFTEQAEKQLQKATNSYLIHYNYLTPTVYTDVKDSGINLTIRHLCDPRSRRTITEAMWEDILDAVDDAHDIDLAYPTMRILSESDAEPPPKD